MFNPSQADVRRFFCQVYAKTHAPHTANAGEPLSALEQIASLWIQEHPEYWGDLADVNAALNRDYAAADNAQGSKSNPFLHLSMHLSISEQCSIDQPRGVRSAMERLVARKDDLHSAHHEAMDSLGLMLWKAQQAGLAPDGEHYVQDLQRRATKD